PAGAAARAETGAPRLERHVVHHHQEVTGDVHLLVAEAGDDGGAATIHVRKGFEHARSHPFDPTIGHGDRAVPLEPAEIPALRDPVGEPPAHIVPRAGVFGAWVAEAGDNLHRLLSSPTDASPQAARAVGRSLFLARFSLTTAD